MFPLVNSWKLNAFFAAYTPGCKSRELVVLSWCQRRKQSSYVASESIKACLSKFNYSGLKGKSGRTTHFFVALQTHVTSLCISYFSFTFKEIGYV